MPLPALDGFNSYRTSRAEAPRPPLTTPGAPPEPPEPPAQIADLPLMQANGPPSRLPHTGTRKSPEQQALERLLSGAAYARESAARVAMAGLASSAGTGL